MIDPGPRPYTPEEVRDLLLDHVRNLVSYWEREARAPDAHAKLEGLAFSILAALDGCANLPAFLVTPVPHETDRAYHEDEGSNWYPEDRPDLGPLHEFFYKGHGELPR